MFPGGVANSTTEEHLVLFNPANRPLSATVAALAGGTPMPISGLQAVTVGPGARADIRINDHAANLDAALIVQASAALFIERDLYGAAKQTGYDLSAGVPLGL